MIEKPKIEEPGDPCSVTLNPCDPLTLCTNVNGTALCGSCPNGTTDVNNNGTQCQDVNECEATTSPCASNQTCTNNIGSFMCNDCQSGYIVVNNACADINECNAPTNPCDPLTSCTNTSGSFTCSACPNGYLDVNNNGTQCLDINECLTTPCEPNQTCTNNQGSYLCSPCPQGYTANNDATACQDINECTTTPNICGLDKTCTNTQGSHTCCAQACIDAGGLCMENNMCAILVIQSEALRYGFCNNVCTLSSWTCNGGGSVGLDCKQHADTNACNNPGHFIYSANQGFCSPDWDGGATTNACTGSNNNSSNSWCCICDMTQ